MTREVPANAMPAESGVVSARPFLRDSGVRFHLSEVKGPVMDQLARSELLQHLTGSVFLSHYQAMQALDPELRADEGSTTTQHELPAVKIGRSGRRD